MAKYVCPLCNKIYYGVNELADCTARDAKAISEKEEQLKQTELQRQHLAKDLETKKAEIEVLYSQLLKKVREYNQLGIKLVSIDPKADAHCTTTLSFTSGDANIFDARDIYKGESYFKNKNGRDKSDLDTLIDNIFNF